MISKPNLILVPTDFSDTASHAIRYASDLAKRIDASLLVVYADTFTPPIDFTATVGAFDEDSFAALKLRAKGELERDAKTNIDPSVAYSTAILVASPIDGILAQAQESGAGLIVMGTHGRTGVRRLIVGSVTEGVMRKAEAPVIAVPPWCESSPEIKTVVCPAAYNDQCRDALAFAALLAPPDAKFIVIRATNSDDAAATAEDLVELRAWVPQSIAARCEPKLFGHEHVADQIESYAAKIHADLIVAAEPARRSASDVLYGTFAARLVQHSDRPVLTMSRQASKRTAQTAAREPAAEARTNQ